MQNVFMENRVELTMNGQTIVPGGRLEAMLFSCAELDREMPDVKCQLSARQPQYSQRKRLHAIHHRFPHYNYGVTMSLWDLIFHTGKQQ